ncbi:MULTISPECIES: hypothetical protein [unclassified Streptomyces]|uniref:hypothetical protein n=1 Tax=unclassified Streptomyces TaxID=2593676 RepID=UPI001F16120E|nr:MULTISPECIES: hypothetical protein [unclassified Streptomyces]MCF0086585.1 hypothetical protein [Streptomyces sp. MH192]MCF0098739.1 hypothetical protein [Streptomyces sp. MH191]
MTQKRTIGSQLDDLGLALDLEEGHRVLEATVTLVTGNDDYGVQHRPIELPMKEPGSIPVPHLVERRVITVVAEDQELSAEQLDRVRTWLTANGIDPAVVAGGTITIEGTMYRGELGRQYIGFHQYYLENGSKVHAPIANSAVKFHRYVEQVVELEPDPAWEGLDPNPAEHGGDE